MARMSRHVDDERVGIGIENEPMSASAAELKQVSARGGGESASAVAVSRRARWRRVRLHAYTLHRSTYMIVEHFGTDNQYSERFKVDQYLNV